MSDIRTKEPGENVICWGCGARHRRLQWMNRYGADGWYCTAQFTCEEDREDTPVCVYCDHHYVPEAHRHCQVAPKIDGLNAHSLVDERPRLEAERKKREEDELRKKQIAQKQDGKLTPEEYLRKILTEQVKLKGSTEDATEQLKRVQKALEKIDQERKKQPQLQLQGPPGPRGEIVIDHINKKRYVSTGERWLEISQLAWAEWNRKGFNMDNIPGEFAEGGEIDKEFEIFIDESKQIFERNYRSDLDQRSYYDQFRLESQNYHNDWYRKK